MKGSEKAARVARHSNSWVPASAGMTLFGGEQSFGAAQIDADEAADAFFDHGDAEQAVHAAHRSEEHTSELQSLMRISYAVFCLKKNNIIQNTKYSTTNNK